MDWKILLMAFGAAFALYAMVAGMFGLIYVLVKFTPWMIPVLTFLVVVTIIYVILKEFRGKK